MRISADATCPVAAYAATSGCYGTAVGPFVTTEIRMVPVLAVGPFALATHDAFTVVALLVGLGLYYRELARRGWLDERIVWISLAAIVGGAIGARTITAWEHLDYYAAAAAANVPVTELIENSGKSIIGAVAGGYLGTTLAKRRFGYTRSTGDCYVLAIPIATAIGRVGCFLTELPLGTPTTLPWGVSVDPVIASGFAVCPGCTLPMHNFVRARSRHFADLFHGPSDGSSSG